MGYRECPNHGWLETGEYVTVPGHGETICPVCETAVTGFYADVGSAARAQFGGPTHAPRKRFTDAVSEFFERTEGMSYDEYKEAYPVMEGYELES